MSCFRFIAAEKANHPVGALCRALGVSRSGFHAWERRGPSHRARSDRELLERIREVHSESRASYGWPRVHAELRHRGVRVSRKRVARLMRSAGLCGLVRRRRGPTTIRVAGVRPAPDRVRRDFRPAEPNALWVADLTQVATWEGPLYVALVLDCFSRRVVGWAMAEHMRSELVVEALEMAVWQRRPSIGLVHHSDQGSQGGLNRSSQQCFGEGTIWMATAVARGSCRSGSAGVTRLSSRRLARRAGRSGDSRVRAGRALS